MIISKLKGGLGNQMFQYATLFSIAKTKNYDFGVPFSNKNYDEYKHFCLPECFPNLKAKDSSNHPIKGYVQERIFGFDLEFLKLPYDIDIFGYFQTEKYFTDIQEHIKNDFIFKREILEKAQNKIDNIKNNNETRIYLRCHWTRWILP